MKSYSFNNVTALPNEDAYLTINFGGCEDGNKIAVKLVAVNKYNYFRIRDRVNDSRLRYRPIRDLSLGVGVSYKWFTLDKTFALSLRNNSELGENSSAIGISITEAFKKEIVWV